MSADKPGGGRGRKNPSDTGNIFGRVASRGAPEVEDPGDESRTPARREQGRRGPDGPRPDAREEIRSGGEAEDEPGGRARLGGSPEPIPEDALSLAVAPDARTSSPADALQRYLDGADRLGAKTSKGFDLPGGHAVALQLIRAHLMNNVGFTAREASMSNMVAAMIDQWHESIFGRPVDR